MARPVKVWRGDTRWQTNRHGGMSTLFRVPTLIAATSQTAAAEAVGMRLVDFRNQFARIEDFTDLRPDTRDSLRDMALVAPGVPFWRDAVLSAPKGHWHRFGDPS